MKIPSIFRIKDHHHRQKWSSCNYPKTNSFRDTAAAGEEIFKTVNSVFFDSVIDGVETPNSIFTNASETTTSFSFSTESEEFEGESIEVVVRNVRSERLFYEPDDTSSIIGGKAKGFPLEDSVIMSMESEDPYGDFRRSIEEMVESHRIKDWDSLEELLGWYLKVNVKKNHGFIVEAFVDVLVSVTESDYSDSTATTTTFSTALSSFSSSSSVINGGNDHEIEGSVLKSGFKSD